MGKMKELNQCIQEVVRDDVKVQEEVTNQIQAYLSGEKPFEYLSWEAKYSIQLWEATPQEELAPQNSRYSFCDLRLFKI